MCPQGGDLQVEDLLGQGGVSHEVTQRSNWRGGLIGEEPDALVDGCPTLMEFGREGWIPELGCRVGGPCIGGPTAEGPMIWVSRHPIRPVRDDDLRVDLCDQVRDDVGAVDFVTATVRADQDAQLGDTENGEAVD